LRRYWWQRIKIKQYKYVFKVKFISSFMRIVDSVESNVSELRLIPRTIYLARRFGKLTMPSRSTAETYKLSKDNLVIYLNRDSDSQEKVELEYDDKIVFAAETYDDKIVFAAETTGQYQEIARAIDFESKKFEVVSLRLGTWIEQFNRIYTKLTQRAQKDLTRLLEGPSASF